MSNRVIIVGFIILGSVAIQFLGKTCFAALVEASVIAPTAIRVAIIGDHPFVGGCGLLQDLRGVFSVAGADAYLFDVVRGYVVILPAADDGICRRSIRWG